MSAESERDAAHNRETMVRLGVMLSDVFVGCVQEAQRSVVEGSALTGAPGQPVQTGFLKGSWQVVYDSPNQATIGTNVAYAESIEDGVSYAHGGKPMTLRSEVGGWHSVAHTVENFDRIVLAVKSRVMDGAK
jgi:hypothetical protein